MFHVIFNVISKVQCGKLTCFCTHKLFPLRGCKVVCCSMTFYGGVTMKSAISNFQIYEKLLVVDKKSISTECNFVVEVMRFRLK